MERIEIRDGRSLTVDGVDFIIDCSRGARRPSYDQAFTLVKPEPYIRFYESLAAHFQPRGLLELGVFQGGSYVLLDKIFRPGRMSAVEISPVPVAPLMRHVERTPGRSVHFGTSQSDRDALRGIVARDLGGELDLVVDDASHMYGHSRASFEVLFPLLSPHGVYIIEDWAWAHYPHYQGEGAPNADQPALTSLLFEQILLLGSTNLIAEIQVRRPFYCIRRSGVPIAPDVDLWSLVANRGRDWPQI